MKDGSVAVKIDFPESDFAGATIYLEDWQAERLKARVDVNNRCLRSRGFPADYTVAHAIHFALEMYFRSLERKESPDALEAFKAEVQNLMDQEIEANVGRPEVLKQILEAGKEE